VTRRMTSQEAHGLQPAVMTGCKTQEKADGNPNGTHHARTRWTHKRRKERHGRTEHQGEVSSRLLSTERKREEAGALAGVTSGRVVMALVPEDKKATEENSQSHRLSPGHDRLAKPSSYRQQTSRHFQMKNLQLLTCSRTLSLPRNAPLLFAVTSSSAKT